MRRGVRKGKRVGWVSVARFSSYMIWMLKKRQLFNPNQFSWQFNRHCGAELAMNFPLVLSLSQYLINKQCTPIKQRTFYVIQTHYIFYACHIQPGKAERQWQCPFSEQAYFKFLHRKLTPALLRLILVLWFPHQSQKKRDRIVRSRSLDRLY